MRAADKAFKAAQRLIKHARDQGDAMLDLNTEETRALQQLPKEIADLAQLQSLTLANTQITDLWPVSKLRGLLDDEYSFSGLHFKNIPALGLDKNLQELADIGDDHERTRKTFDYLDSLNSWPPLPDGISPDNVQTGQGFRYTTSQTGQISYDQTPANIPDDPKLSQLHQLLHSDVKSYLDKAPTDDQFYSELTDKVVEYKTRLTPTVNEIVPMLLWKSGDDLRVQLRDYERQEADRGSMANVPPLGSPLRTTLESLVRMHNVFASLHPEISVLDNMGLDPAERHKAELNPELVHQLVAALQSQDLIIEKVRSDLSDLRNQAQGDGKGALRALFLEDESLQNMIAQIVSQAVIDASHQGLGSKVLADLRGVAVGGVAGAAATTLGPEIATNYPQLVTVLEPYIAQLMNIWHGPDSNIKNAADWAKLWFKHNPPKDNQE